MRFLEVSTPSVETVAADEAPMPQRGIVLIEPPSDLLASFGMSCMFSTTASRSSLSCEGTPERPFSIS
jgi:hypothetical protein